jgi:spore maturation protein A
MNKIWIVLVVFCLLYGLIRGNAAQMVEALLNVPNKSIEMLLKIGGLLILHNGILQIAVDSGMIKAIGKCFRKPLKKLFPNLQEESPALEFISLSLVANLLGMGAAGTPSTIKALRIMRAENNNQDKATPEMSKFLLLNVASFTVFPITALSIRRIYHASINLELIPYFMALSLLLSVIAILIYNLTGKKHAR